MKIELGEPKTVLPILSHYRVFGILSALAVYFVANEFVYTQVGHAALIAALYMFTLSIIGDITEQICYSIEVGSKRAQTKAQLEVLREINKRLGK